MSESFSRRICCRPSHIGRTWHSGVIALGRAVLAIVDRQRTLDGLQHLKERNLRRVADFAFLSGWGCRGSAGDQILSVQPAQVHSPRSARPAQWHGQSRLREKLSDMKLSDCLKRPIEPQPQQPVDPPQPAPPSVLSS